MIKKANICTKTTEYYEFFDINIIKIGSTYLEIQFCVIKPKKLVSFDLNDLICIHIALVFPKKKAL